MSDGACELVRQLRKQAGRLSKAAYYADVGLLLAQAADEIEKLSVAEPPKPVEAAPAPTPSQTERELSRANKRIAELEKDLKTVTMQHRNMVVSQGAAWSEEMKWRERVRVLEARLGTV